MEFKRIPVPPDVAGLFRETLGYKRAIEHLAALLGLREVEAWRIARAIPEIAALDPEYVIRYDHSTEEIIIRLSSAVTDAK